MASERNNMCGISKKCKIWDVRGIEIKANINKKTAVKFENSDVY